jgi:type I restriction enzyme, S subunit
VLQNKPSHWAEVPIGEVLNYLDEQVMFDDMAEYITITVKRRHGGLEAREKLFGHEIKTKKQYRLHRGAFIISRIQCWHAAFAIVPDDIPDNMIASQNYDQFEISPKVDNRFFWWLSHSPQFIETVRSSASGVVIEKLVFNRDAWLQKTIPLPPLDEQRHIVSHIESLAVQVNEAQRLREEAKIETELLFSKATKEIFAKHLGNVTKIGDEFRVTTGGTPSRSNPSYWEGDVRWVSSGEVAFNRIYDTREKITELGVSESNAKIYPPKTVLIAMIGQGKTRGQCAILECHAGTNQNVAGIHVYETNHLPEYVYWWLRSRYLESRFSEIGTAQPALSGERVKQMPIPLPPLDEQRRIVAYLDGLQAKVKALRELQSASGEELSTLMPSILDKAFKGEL